LVEALTTIFVRLSLQTQSDRIHAAKRCSARCEAHGAYADTLGNVKFTPPASKSGDKASCRACAAAVALIVMLPPSGIRADTLKAEMFTN